MKLFKQYIKYLICYFRAYLRRWRVPAEAVTKPNGSTRLMSTKR